MIGRFFNWLGQLIASFISWVVNTIRDLFSAFVQSIQNFFDFLSDHILNLPENVLTYVLSLLPESSLESTRSGFATARAGITFARSCWVVADDFVPLSEGFAMILAFISFYVTVKVIGFIIRVILALVP